MFGKNPVQKPELDLDGQTLRVVDGKPWYTIQGEGPFAGQPAVFLRLHGCPLRCYFCDTEFSQPTDPWLSVTDIANAIEACRPGHVRLLVITGGEPVRQNLKPLINIMTGDGWTVQIETSGILWQDCLLDTVVVCSPKTPVIQPKIWDYAHAFKYVIKAGEVDPMDGLPVTDTQDEGGKPRRLARPRPGAEVYLSPLDEGGELVNNTPHAMEVARQAMKFGYRAGLQLHKYMGVP